LEEFAETLKSAQKLLSSIVCQHLPITLPTTMEQINRWEKWKGLKNGKDWETGNLKIYDNDMAVIYRENNQVYIFKDSASRFTGFVNASGKEIYEGDLLADGDVIHGSTEIKVVFWNNDHQQWKVGPSPTEQALLSHPLEHYLNHQIVGHIYTHQHLLDTSKTKAHDKAYSD